MLIASIVLLLLSQVRSVEALFISCSETEICGPAFLFLFQPYALCNEDSSEVCTYLPFLYTLFGYECGTCAPTAPSLPTADPPSAPTPSSTSAPVKQPTAPTSPNPPTADPPSAPTPLSTPAPVKQPTGSATTTIEPTVTSGNTVMNYFEIGEFQSRLFLGVHQDGFTLGGPTGYILDCYDDTKVDEARVTSTDQLRFKLPLGCFDQPVRVAADVCSSGWTNFDTVLSVWRITEDQSSIVCVERNDDSDECAISTHSLVSWDAYPGAEYFVFVYGWGGVEGEYRIKVDLYGPQPTPAPTPELPAAPPTSDFAKACVDRPEQFLYDNEMQGEVVCECFEGIREVKCRRRHPLHGYGCIGVTLRNDCCCVDIDRWIFDEDGKFKYMEMCKECTGQDCVTVTFDYREQCLRLYYTGGEITGCDVVGIYEQCRPDNLPVCGTCSLCRNEFDLPGLEYTCFDYHGRSPSGPNSINPGGCESLDYILLIQGHQFP